MIGPYRPPRASEPPPSQSPFRRGSLRPDPAAFASGAHILRIVVYGIPGPQGSKKFVGMVRGKDGREHANMQESSKKVRPWRRRVMVAAKLTIIDSPPLDCPLSVRMIFTMPKPKSAPKRRRTWPMRYPDVSKLARSTEDALTEAGVWSDDARVIEYQRLAKVYPGEDVDALDRPGAVIEIRVAGTEI